jgi:hypothetical protein
MTDLFDRLAAKAGDGQGAMVPAPPPIWGPGLAEEVQMVPAVPTVLGPSAPIAPLLPLPPTVTPQVLTQAPPASRFVSHPSGALPEPPALPQTHIQPLHPVSQTRPPVVPQHPLPAPDARAAPVATLTPAPRDRPGPKLPSASLAPMPKASLPPLSASVSGGADPAGVQQSAVMPTTHPVAPAAPQPAPVRPDIRISIGHIRVIAPQPAPTAAPVARAAAAPKGQALKAYLGWRR